MSAEIEQHAIRLLLKKLNPPGIVSFPLGDSDLVFDGDDAVQVPLNPIKAIKAATFSHANPLQGVDKSRSATSLNAGRGKGLAAVDKRGDVGRVREPSIGISLVRNQRGGPFVVTEIDRLEHVQADIYS